MAGREINNATVGWASTKERGNVLAVRLVFWLYRWGGFLLVYPLVWLAVAYFFVTHSAPRYHSRRYLQRVLGRPVGLGLLWRHQLAFGRSLIHRAAAWMGRIKRTQVLLSCHQTLEELQRKRQGPILLSAHFGNLEMCRALVENDQSLTLNVIMRTEHGDKFNRVLHSISQKSRVRLISLDEITPATAMLLQDKLARGEILIMMADRLAPDNPERYYEQSFFGETARFPAGPFWLAALLEGPVYFFVGYETPKGYSSRFELLKSAGRVPRSQRDPLCRQMLADYARHLEDVCREEPLQWFNFYDFWNRDVY